MWDLGSDRRILQLSGGGAESLLKGSETAEGSSYWSSYLCRMCCACKEHLSSPGRYHYSSPLRTALRDRSSLAINRQRRWSLLNTAATFPLLRPLGYWSALHFRMNRLS
jgi:hypothetical protein